ncbi:hypothetical protein HAZT_HAZT009817, partial [Hyalella azteca]
MAVYAYEKTYEWRLLEMDWCSNTAWWTAIVAVDFCFYWFHRFTHGILSRHQVHHTSEDFNLGTALRHSALLKTYSSFFYLPLALIGFPITLAFTHLQFNIIFQFWLHTKTVSTVGPLELIFNTPSHHRVHHDKNYAGVLIIWDKIFGTFQPELKSREIVYGLVDQPQSVNAVYLEVFYLKKVYEKFSEQTTWADGLKSIFYGPGWTPGSPRLGHPVPQPPPQQPTRKKYDPKLPRSLELYLFFHF